MLAIVLLLGACAAHAAIETFQFASEEQRQRYLEFTRELRCPKCQNQNLADSNAPIAQDLRRELYRLLDEGRSDQEILDFMVTRYGEYVLYKPPVERKTWLLWSAPLLLLGIGTIVVGTMLRRTRRDAAPGAGDVSPSLSERERSRLNELLGNEGKGQ